MRRDIIKRAIKLLVLVALLITPSMTLASGQTGAYITPKVMYGYIPGSDIGPVSFNGDSVFGVALAVGYDLSKQSGSGAPVRLEVEYALFSEAKIENTTYFGGLYLTGGAKTNTNTLFANAYYDLHTNSGFTPYVGLGLGVAFVDMKGYGYFFTGMKGSSTNFAWNLSIGTNFSPAPSSPISCDLGYRFVSLGDTPKFYGSSGNLYMHQLIFGLRYAF